VDRGEGVDLLHFGGWGADSQYSQIDFSLGQFVQEAHCCGSCEAGAMPRPTSLSPESRCLGRRACSIDAWQGTGDWWCRLREVAAGLSRPWLQCSGSLVSERMLDLKVEMALTSFSLI